MCWRVGLRHPRVDRQGAPEIEVGWSWTLKVSGGGSLGPLSGRELGAPGGEEAWIPLRDKQPGALEVQGTGS